MPTWRTCPTRPVELVVFDRTARRAFEQFVAAKDIAAALAKARAAGTLTGGNGSALEEGLGLAATALQGRHGPTRIVALTDALLRSRFRNALADPALALAPGATVTHLVIPEQDSEAWIRRDDAHDLAPIADGHRGVLFAVSAPRATKRWRRRCSGSCGRSRHRPLRYSRRRPPPRRRRCPRRCARARATGP